MSNFMSYENAQSVLGEFAEAIKSGGGGSSEPSSLLIVTFDSDFIGENYTIKQGNTTIKTGTVPQSCEVRLTVQGANETYYVYSSIDSKEYSNSVNTVEYYGEYKVHLYKYHIYGARWASDPSPVWERTDDAAEFTDPVAYVAGSENYGSPFDNIYPWSGMTVIPSYERAGECVAIPRFWYQLQEYGDGGLWIRISDAPAEGFEVSPAHRKHWTADDSDYEREAVLVGRYLSTLHTAPSPLNYKYFTSYGYGTPYNSGVSNPIYSNVQTFSTNTGVNTYPFDFDTFFTVWMLYLVEFANWQHNITIGRDLPSDCGMVTSMPYHTGTMSSGRDTAGGTQYRYIEHFIPGSGSCWLFGISVPADKTLLTPYHVRLCDDMSIRDKFATTDMGEDNYRIFDVGVIPSDAYIITKFRVVKKGTFSLFLPSVGVSPTDDNLTTYTAVRTSPNAYITISGSYSSKPVTSIYGIGRNSASSAEPSSGGISRLLIRCPNGTITTSN